jgi:hypothetical protein
MREITYGRAEVWDNGPAAHGRYHLKFYYTTLPISEINPAKLNVHHCVFSKVKDFKQHNKVDDLALQAYMDACCADLQTANRGRAEAEKACIGVLPPPSGISRG